MRKKYFFFDIDRTLGLDISQIIPADTAYCLNRLRQLGHSVAIATGRLQCDSFRTASRYGITSLVSDGGNSLNIDNTLIEMNKPAPSPTAGPFSTNWNGAIFLGCLLQTIQWSAYAI